MMWLIDAVRHLFLLDEPDETAELAELDLTLPPQCLGELHSRALDRVGVSA